ncbi:hypothetical protein [Archangium sp.]|uniref:hypothetical protein n=1 Tax=Archangium sp. TaxID=1872627 RepID=UPI00286D2192|nr:hypothetical protein [Archangium sp.]
MDLSEKPGINGVLTIDICDASGALVEQRRIPNLITTAGKQLLANLLIGRLNAMPTRWAIVVGTGQTTAPALGDTALEKKVDEAADTSPKVEIVTKGDGIIVVRATVSATLPALNLAPTDKPQALTEAGIQITQGTNPILFNRVRFEQVNRGANMVMKMAWEISF